MLFFNRYTENPCNIDQDTKRLIQEFCLNQGTPLTDDFWNVGNLRSQSAIANIYGKIGDTLIGTEEEKTKFRLVEEIKYSILCYSQYREYFEALDKLVYCSLIVNNSGTMHDEDIDVKIMVPKGLLLNNDEFPTPGNLIIEEINKSGFINKFFCRKGKVDIDSYSDYPIDLHNEIPEYLLSLQRDVAQEIRRNQNKYRQSIAHFFCYTKFSERDIDIVEFNIQYLKQHKSVYFPTITLLKSVPQYIDFDIRSKNCSEIIGGRLNIKK